MDGHEWHQWINQPFSARQGIRFRERSPVQRDAAFRLIGAGLSAKGLRLTRDIRKLNHTPTEVNNNGLEQYGEWRSNITVMGTPAATEPWGWRMDGHHCNINYFLWGNQVVMTPVFGKRPVRAH